jgi:methylenetetrahydrofolate dehydrogenase (NADP+)/methenyltetrahydrofolate cyclohydrolase
MIIDGKKIAEEIKEELKEQIAASPPAGGLKLAIVQVGDDLVSKKFIERKIKFAEEIGIKTKVYNLPVDISTNKLRQKMAEISHIKENNGVILQLPLPSHINTQYVLNGIVPKKDVDVLSSRAFGNFSTNRSKILPPVVGAIKIVLDKAGVDLKGKYAVVIGRGILVGKPVAVWLISEGATFSVLNSKTKDISKFIKDADIILTGIGKPHFITADMVKDGVIIIDAGTSISSQSSVAGSQTKIVGDVEPAIAKKASIFTPVPGGIGPITVAMIFKNLLELNKSSRLKQ